MNDRRRFFTLLEVVIALAIFAMGLIGSLTLIGSAAKRIDSAVKRWERQHLLAQAAEFFILNGFDDSNIPNEFFPNNDCRLKLETTDPDDLPDDMDMEDSKWQLKKVIITLLDNNGKEIDLIEFDRIIYVDQK